MKASPRRTAVSKVRFLVLPGGMVLAVIVNVLLTWIADALGADSRSEHLDPVRIAAFAAGGATAACIGWLLIVKFARNSRRILAALVPILFVVTAIPDVLMMTESLPLAYTGFAEGLTLLVAHVVVMGIIVPALAYACPAIDRGRAFHPTDTSQQITDR